MNFYDYLDSINEQITSGEVRPDQLGPVGMSVYMMGRGELKYDELGPTTKPLFDAQFGGSDPTSLGAAVGQEFKKGLTQAGEAGRTATTGLTEGSQDPLAQAAKIVKNLAWDAPAGVIRALGAPAKGLANWAGTKYGVDELAKFGIDMVGGLALPLGAGKLLKLVNKTPAVARGILETTAARDVAKASEIGMEKGFTTEAGTASHLWQQGELNPRQVPVDAVTESTAITPIPGVNIKGGTPSNEWLQGGLLPGKKIPVDDIGLTSRIKVEPSATIKGGTPSNEWIQDSLLPKPQSADTVAGTPVTKFRMEEVARDPGKLQELADARAKLLEQANALKDRMAGSAPEVRQALRQEVANLNRQLAKINQGIDEAGTIMRRRTAYEETPQVPTGTTHDVGLDAEQSSLFGSRQAPDVNVPARVTREGPGIGINPTNEVADMAGEGVQPSLFGARQTPDINVPGRVDRGAREFGYSPTGETQSLAPFEATQAELGKDSLLDARTIPDRTVNLGPQDVHYNTGERTLVPGQLDQRGIQQELLHTVATGSVDRVATAIKHLPAELAPDTPDGWGKRLWDVTKEHLWKISNLSQKSLGATTLSFPTAARNFVQQSARTVIELPVQVYQDVMQTGSLTGAMDKAAEQVRGLWGEIAKKTPMEDVLANLPEDLAKRLATRGMYGEDAVTKLPSYAAIDKKLDASMKALSAPNNAQEKFFFNSAFRAEMDRLLLAQKGTRLGEFNAKFGKAIDATNVPEDILKAAYAHAAEMVYSNELPEGISNAITAVNKMVPFAGWMLTQGIQPFARFNWANALKDIVDFSPLGATRALTKNGPEQARLVAKSIVGTKMIDAAVQQKTDGTDEWQVINLPGLGKIDSRRLHPLDSYAMLGELINRPMGSPNSKVTLPDLLQWLAGTTRLDDTATGILFKALSSPDTTGEGLKGKLTAYFGDLAARWTTPAKTLQSVERLASPLTGDTESLKERDVLQGKFGILDKAVNNLPYVNRYLPERIDPTQPETPAFKNVGEVIANIGGLDPIRTNKLKEELTRLKISGPQGDEFSEALGLTQASRDVGSGGDLNKKMYARMGDPKMNRAINDLMSQIVSPKLTQLMTNPEYLDLGDAERRLVLTNIISQAKGGMKQYALGQAGPKSVFEDWIKRQPIAVRALLDKLSREQNLPTIGDR